MAQSANKPPDPITRRVIASKGEGIRVWTLPVNPGFADPNEMDEQRGVDPGDREAGQAERAIVARVLDDLVPSGPALRTWIAQQQTRRGGLGGLTDTLLAMRPIPAGRDEKLYRASLLRSLQRSGPEQKAERREGHASIRLPDYRARIGLLVARDVAVSIATRGWWRIATTPPDEHYSWFGGELTDAVDVEAARAVLRDGGDELIAVCERMAAARTNYPTELTALHGLRIEVEA